MRQRECPGGQAGAATGPTAGRCVQPDYTTIAPPSQAPICTLANLVAVAHEKAGRCQALADAYRALGDRGLANHWRRQMLRHQAIYRAARTPHAIGDTSWL